MVILFDSDLAAEYLRSPQSLSHVSDSDKGTQYQRPCKLTMAQDTQRVTCFSISGLVIAIIGVCMGGVAFDEIKTLRNYQVVTRDVLDANTKQDALTTQTLTDKINSLEAAIIANTQRDDSTAQTLTNKINKLEDTLRDAIAANTQQDTCIRL